MLTRLLAVLGGLSPHSSSISVSVETSWPGRTSRQASSDRHLGALIAVQPRGDSTSSGPKDAETHQASLSERTLSSASRE